MPARYPWTRRVDGGDNNRMLRLLRRVLDTPVGPMAAVAAPSTLVALEFCAPDRHQRLGARLAAWLPDHVLEDGSSPILDAAAQNTVKQWTHNLLQPDPLSQRWGTLSFTFTLNEPDKPKTP